MDGGRFQEFLVRSNGSKDACFLSGRPERPAMKSDKSTLLGLVWTYCFGLMILRFVRSKTSSELF